MIILILKDSDRNMVVFIKVKKALIKRLIFFKLPLNLIESLIISSELFHMKVVEEIVMQKLITQARTKVSEPEKLNFQILQII